MAKRDAFEHDNVGLAKYEEGENIAWFMGKGKVCTTEITVDCYPCSKAVQPWYDEIKDYDFQKGAAKSPGLPVLHFTQVQYCICSFLNKFYVLYDTNLPTTTPKLHLLSLYYLHND